MDCLLLSMKHDIVYAGKDKSSTATIIAIVVPIAALVLVLVILSYCFLRRARKKTNAIKGESSKKSNHILNYQGMRVVLYLHHMSPSSHFQDFMKMMLTYSSVSDVVQV